MANYLERVATSAGRRAAIAKPPNSGPPVLPAGRDFSLAVEDPFASEQDQFLDPLETPEPARTEERTATPAPKLEGAREAQPAATRNTPVVAAVEQPEPRPRRPAHERLNSEAPFTVHLPRTLRPIGTPDVPPTVTSEPAREQPRARAQSTVGPFAPRIAEEPVPIVRFSDVDITDVNPPVTKEVETTALPARPDPSLAERSETYQAPVPKSKGELSDVTPEPRVDGVDGPPAFPSHRVEPSPPPAMPVHLPAVAGSTARQEPSRISIGSLEVLVNNPRVTPVRPAAAPARSEQFNLEKRYLDRFRLRH